MKAAAERSGFAPVKNAEVYGSLAAASFVFNLVQTVMNIFDPGRGDWKIYPGREAGRIRGRLTCDEV